MTKKLCFLALGSQRVVQEQGVLFTVLDLVARRVGYLEKRLKPDIRLQT